MKKVVILSAFVTPMRSGAEACAEEVAARLQGAYDITIVAARMRPDVQHIEKLPNGVRIWRVGLGNSVDKWLYPFLAPRIVRALRPDIVHAVLESFAGLAMMRCTKRKGMRKILTCQSTNTSLLVGAMHRSADTVTAISSVLMERAKKFGKTAIHIPNGIDLSLINTARTKHPKIDGRILFVGRLEPMKGVNTVIAAFAALAPSHPEAHLIIVGDGSLRRTLEAQEPALMKEGRISFRGYLPIQRIADEFAQTSMFCGLSRSEALGNVFLEAQAAGCAVVATKIGGIPDIVTHEKTGLLVGPDNIPAAASALERLLTDDALRTRLAAEGEKNAAGYDWAVIARRYAEVYEQ